MSPLLQAVLATTAVSALALIGAAVLRGSWWNERNELRVVSFAAGVLLATVFLDVIPEALEAAGNTDVLIGVLVAMTLFFFAERFMHGRHSHGSAGHESHMHHHTSSRYFILVGDGLHNFVDGVAIGVSFLISTELGIATTLAVAAHELPHEIADFGILIRGGYSRNKALFFNFLSGLTAVLGALTVFMFGGFAEEYLGWLLAGAAGMFIYIAAVNLMPELHHQPIKGRFIYGAPFLIGILTIAVLTQLIPA